MIGHVALLVLALGAKGPAPKPYQPTAEELSPIQAKTAELSAALERLAARRPDPDLLPDVEIYLKAATWIVRYADEEFYDKRYVADTLAALDRGLARAKELGNRKPSWPTQKGLLIRAYRSRIDDSVQPYGLSIPASYDGSKPVRLDVVLHGRGGTLNEVSFIAAHDSPKAATSEQDYIRLDIFGRVNNAYRWAGETDVFEALASVQKRYKIDPRRIVLRGFSMGGAGTWHIGLQYPDRWTAIEAGAGFTDTKRYAKLDSLPPYQESTLHVYDAVDYALNAFNVPTVAYVGEEDPSIRSTTYIREQLVKEGFQFTPDGLNFKTKDLKAVFLVGPKIGHKFHPDSKQESDQFIQANLAHKNTEPSRIRFVTYTTRYNECYWIKVGALTKHYERADVDAQRSSDGHRLEITTHNVAQLILPARVLGRSLRVDGKTVVIPPTARKPSAELTLDKQQDAWTVRSATRAPADAKSLRKIHGLQGPIDDAFADSFLCVRPTGQPQQKLVHEYAQATLDTFNREFSKWMRADVRVKDDTKVTPADIANHNLVLFGDPGSNKILGQIIDRLPIQWTEKQITVGAKAYTAADHTLVMIYPNPLNPSRYVVINSGHTFHEREFRGTNALLFPRLGDYAILRLAKDKDAAESTVEEAGLFGDHWELTAKP